MLTVTDELITIQLGETELIINEDKLKIIKALVTSGATAIIGGSLVVPEGSDLQVGNNISLTSAGEINNGAVNIGVDGTLTLPNAQINPDGSGNLAANNISWDTAGNLEVTSVT